MTDLLSSPAVPARSGEVEPFQVDLDALHACQLAGKMFCSLSQVEGPSPLVPLRIIRRKRDTPGFAVFDTFHRKRSSCRKRRCGRCSRSALPRRRSGGTVRKEAGIPACASKRCALRRHGRFWARWTKGNMIWALEVGRVKDGLERAARCRCLLWSRATTRM